MVRHVFEDMLKVCDMSGVVDMTRMAMSRRFNVPFDELNRCISKLEAPDPHSRDETFEGRRLERLDEHRDWGWRILNWAKYEAIRTRADVGMRVQRHRNREKELGRQAGGQGAPLQETTPPMGRMRGNNRPASIQEVIEAGKMMGLNESSCQRFWLHYEGTVSQDANGRKIWMTGKTSEKQVGNWRALLGSWKARNDEAVRTQRPVKEAHKEPGPEVVLPVQHFEA